MATGAAELYGEEVQQIRSLTPFGTQQLLADLEYFCNVLAALGVALSPSLTTWQVWAPQHAEECKDMKKESQVSLSGKQGLPCPAAA